MKSKKYTVCKENQQKDASDPNKFKRWEEPKYISKTAIMHDLWAKEPQKVHSHEA